MTNMEDVVMAVKVRLLHFINPNVCDRAGKRSIRRFVITEKAPTRAFSWLKALTSTFTFLTLLRYYAKLAPKHGK